MLPVLASIAASRPPHIAFVVADDLGWNDVGFHGSKQVRTPHIDKLAAEGIVLDRYYVQHECSPSRASFLTGRHVAHTGIQAALVAGHDKDMFGRPYGLPLEFSTMPQLLKAHFNYFTVMVGKWHLGMRSPAYLPTRRGFDRFFGYYTGVMDYWGHFDDEGFGVWGAALHQDGENGGLPQPLYNTTGQYSSEAMLAKATDYLHEYANASARGTQGPPLFLYFALQSIHSANNKHLQAPPDALNAYGTISSTFCGPYETTLGPRGRGGCADPAARRRTVAAMVDALDSAVGGLQMALELTGLWNQTLFVFTTDNGGPVDGFNANEASNWPLRGGKANYFEGGVRGIGLVHGAGLTAPPGSTFAGLMHAVDWAPTLLSAAASSVRAHTAAAAGGFDLAGALSKAGEPPLLPGDGQDVWTSLSTAANASSRSEVLLASQASGSPLGHHALIVGWHKLLVEDNFYPFPASCKDRGTAEFDPRCGWYKPPGDDVAKQEPRTTVKCPPPPPPTEVTDWCTAKQPCLFDLEADPCEQHNLANEKPLMLAAMQARLAKYAAQTILPHEIGVANLTDHDARASPAQHNYAWMPWLDDHAEL